MTIIRTSNWKPMLKFYRNLVRFDSEVNHANRVVHFKKTSIDIQLERVETAAEHEVIGSLEFLSVDPTLDNFFQERNEGTFELQSNNDHLELKLDDPDGNTVLLETEKIPKVA